MSDLLKEAIADAKAVRETALRNAKMALEEAFTPQLKSMLSAKLSEEEDSEDMEDEAMHDEVEDEGMHKEAMHGEDEVEDEAMHGEDEVEDEGMHKEAMHGEDEVEDEAMHPEDEAMHPEDEDMDMDMEGEESDDLDLESIIRELELEINEEDDAYPDDVEGDKDPNHIQDLSEEEEADDEEESKEEVYEVELKEEDDAYPDNVEGDKDSNHVVDMKEELSRTIAELDEHKEAITYLKDKIHEVNILNAKLLFTNKLFKEFALDNQQKMRVVETFDRAQTTREIKLVYSTLSENYSAKPVAKKRKPKINESASAKTGSTRPSKQSRKVITEEQVVADRFRKLANIK